MKLYFNADMNEYYSTTPQTGESGDAPAANVRIKQQRKGPYAPPNETLFIPVPYETFSETESYGPPTKK